MPPVDADLRVTIAGDAAIGVGASGKLTVTATNGGPAEAADVVVTVTLPAHVQAGASDPAGTVDAATVRWEVGALAPQAAAELTLEVTAIAEGDGTVIASATTSSPDPAAGNNDGSAPTSQLAIMSGPQADLVVTLVAPATVALTDTSEYVVSVKNLGPSEAQAITLTVSPPPGAQVVSATPGATVTGLQHVWAFATLSVDDSVTVTMRARPPRQGPVQWQALAATTTPDPLPLNNNRIVGPSPLTFRPFQTFQGEAATDQFGWVAENVGDLDGDGAEDVAITAPFNDAGGTDAGRGYVYSSRTGALLFMVTGNVPGGLLGYRVDGLGDVNGDGVPDIVFGAPFGGATPGYALVVSGATGATLRTVTGAANGLQVGRGTGRADDITGDGVPDILIAAPGASPNGVAGSGRVVIYNGATGALHATIDGIEANGTFGEALRTVGDVDGDGVPDIGVGAPTAPGGGRVYVYSGATQALIRTIVAPNGGGSFGQFWLMSPGDIDADGVPDMFSVDINNAGNAGRAYVFSGANGTLLRTFVGQSPGDQFGIGRGVPDVDGDGVPDFVMAAWLRGEGAGQAGKVYLYSGGTGDLLWSFVSTTQNETLGFDLLGLNDVTGDGVADYLVTGGQNSGTGHAYIVPGRPLP
jgi:uncharacterized repeat protein (TIGR01451 family)